MPFLHIVGSTCLEKNFDIAFDFMPGEMDPDYMLAIGNLRELCVHLGVYPGVFIIDNDSSLKKALYEYFADAPHRQCLWHMNNNLKVRMYDEWDIRQVSKGEENEVTERFNTFPGDWHKMVSEPDEETLDVLWAELQLQYKEFVPLITYIDKYVWPIHHEWAEAFCGKLPDFGQKVTSRAESQHCKLKGNIASSQSHIYDVVRDVDHMIKQDIHEHKAFVARTENRVAADVGDIEFSKLHPLVSPQGLRHLKKQLDLAKKDDFHVTECTGNFTAKFGLPCKHRLSRLLTAAGPTVDLILDVKEIHPHWLYESPPTKGVRRLRNIPDISNPAVVKTKGRPKGATNKAKKGVESRDLSQIEHVEATREVALSQRTQETIDITSEESSSSDSEVEVEVHQTRRRVIGETEVVTTHKPRRATKQPKATPKAKPKAKKPTANQQVLAAIKTLNKRIEEISNKVDKTQRKRGYHSKDDSGDEFTPIEDILQSNKASKKPRGSRKCTHKSLQLSSNPTNLRPVSEVDLTDTTPGDLLDTFQPRVTKRSPRKAPPKAPPKPRKLRATKAEIAERAATKARVEAAQVAKSKVRQSSHISISSRESESSDDEDT
jgi:hypothetical protein